MPRSFFSANSRAGDDQIARPAGGFAECAQTRGVNPGQRVEQHFPHGDRITQRLLDACPSRTFRSRFWSHSSAGRASQSHSATSPRHSSRSKRKGARDSSPNRICLCIARPKSAIPHNSRIPAPVNAFYEPTETQARKGNGNRSDSGRHKSGQAPFRAYSSARRRALCCDWLDTASCPRKTVKLEARVTGFPFHRRKKEFVAAMRSLNFSRSLQPFHQDSQIQTFNGNDSERAQITAGRASVHRSR